MRYKKFIVALLILAPTIAGYFFIEKAARDGIVQRETTARYLAANPPPKPMKLEVTGCIRGKEEAGKFGQLLVLETKIRVPCYRTPMIRDLIGEDFLISWHDNTVLESTESEISYSALFTYHGSTISKNDYLTFSKLTKIKGVRIIELRAPDILSEKVVTFYCYKGALGCRANIAFSKSVALILDIHESSLNGISNKELEEIVAHVVITTKVF